MAGNAQKTPLGRSLNQHATRRALDQVNLDGKDLPCRVVAVMGATVKVSFDVQSVFTIPEVVMPVSTSIYSRAPTQVGDLGVAKAADVHIGVVSGLGGVAPTLAQPGNLSALSFHPSGNSTWAPVPDANQHVVQGPNGVLLQTMDGSVSLNLSKAGLVLTIGGVTYTFTAALLATSADVVAGATQISLSKHLHTSSGAGSATSTPIPGT